MEAISEEMSFEFCLRINRNSLITNARVGAYQERSNRVCKDKDMGRSMMSAHFGVINREKVCADRGNGGRKRWLYL